jgi:ribosomal protein S19E (S16A)
MREYNIFVAEGALAGFTNKTGQLLFRVRSDLHKLKNLGFVEDRNERSLLSDNGKKVS